MVDIYLLYGGKALVAWRDPAGNSWGTSDWAPETPRAPALVLLLAEACPMNPMVGDSLGTHVMLPRPDFGHVSANGATPGESYWQRQELLSLQGPDSVHFRNPPPGLHITPITLGAHMILPCPNLGCGLQV